MVTASRARWAARSGVVAIILFLAAVAGGASAQTSAPLPVGAEALTADNAVLLTVFLNDSEKYIAISKSCVACLGRGMQ
jgi:hypothetical protein